MEINSNLKSLQGLVSVTCHLFAGSNFWTYMVKSMDDKISLMAGISRLVFQCTLTDIIINCGKR